MGFTDRKWGEKSVLLTNLQMLMRGKKIKSELEKYKTIFSITAACGPIAAKFWQNHIPQYGG